MKTSVIGYPRIGAARELKFWTEAYFKGQLTEPELKENARLLRRTHWKRLQEAGIELIPSHDFSFYDGMLDTAVLLGAVPSRYRELGQGELATYFAMARGYQGAQGDVRALSMRKWFNTNYHYIVPELTDDLTLALSGSKPFDDFLEAQAEGVLTKPVVIGPFTFLKLSTFKGSKKPEDYTSELIEAYAQLLSRFGEIGAEWLQLDEPSLVTDLTESDLALFTKLYSSLLSRKGSVKVLLQTYFGDIRDGYTEVVSLPFDGIGLDFVEGKETAALVKKHGFPRSKVLFAGVVNGKNIWRNDYSHTLQVLSSLREAADQIVISTSCSLLHVPYTVQAEPQLEEDARRLLAFADEKLQELSELRVLGEDADHSQNPLLLANVRLHQEKKNKTKDRVQARVRDLSPGDFTRSPSFEERSKVQKKHLQLPLLPTTTIGSFPQTREVKLNRSRWKKGELTTEQYQANLRAMIADCIRQQERLGLDVLVHGEYERNDMVEYFGENLSGFLFTKQAWVQSYGTRCVKPPILYADIERTARISVDISAYAQSLTEKPVKGMLTGPVTILNWSFPREDISTREIALQIALAIRDEVLDLEAAGLRMIQVDEAALKEKLPLRKSDWHEDYLDWAIPAFRLVHSGVKPETQIHTHMCYSEFQEMLASIDAMDADVISFEASRSHLAIVDAIQDNGFRTAVGPGVYDIHSPRIPSQEEIVSTLQSMLEKIAPDKCWVNPDCGLKTRNPEEVEQSLTVLVQAAKQVRAELH
ncbi:5-methyltetrahydropteroyltriglutamate--homocysteine S-methyltransferase [Gorillibacterium sp. CAU 1737]|uniref:5-methyltetrahydropteroyltriglutamate-- homocysteine S-methyltransferase n=1 Tax=Gorillibacterium sp. CAU 1737 TaxID=3140362 RepID=UPI00325FFA5C